MTSTRLPVIERLDRRSALQLEPEWAELLGESNATSPFLGWSWIGSWLETLGPDAEIEMWSARDVEDGHLLGVAPFHVVSVRRRGIHLRELRMIGSGRTAADHLDLVVRTDAADRVAGMLWETVNRNGRWDLVDLDGIVAGGHLEHLVLRRATDRPEPIPVPRLPLAASWEEVEERFGRNHRSNLARYARKLDREAGAPVTERLVTDAADLDVTLSALVEMHQAVRTSKGDPGLFSDPATTAYLRTVAHRLLQSGRLRMWRLDVGPDPIAIVWCMRSFDSVAFYTTGFDQEWARYGPGRRIMARAIQGAVAEGATTFDFLRGDESYKRSWGTEMHYDLRLRRPTTGRGRLVTALRAAANAIRRNDRRAA